MSSHFTEEETEISERTWLTSAIHVFSGSDWAGIGAQTEETLTRRTFNGFVFSLSVPLSQVTY